MINRLICQWLIVVSLFVIGCTTSKRVAFASIQCPPDKALVYVYWPGFGPSKDRLAIDVNKLHKALLHSHGYYPLLLNPGSVELGYSFQAHPIYPIRIGEEKALAFILNAGETYYVSYQPWSGWKPKLVLKDYVTGQREIASCTLGKAWQ